MKVIHATDEHVQTAKQWLCARGGPEESDAGFSATGFVVPDLAAVWLYLTNSGVAMIEHLTANPAASKQDRDAALNAVLSSALAEAEALGAVSVIAMVGLPIVEARLRKHGFTAVQRNMTAMVRTSQEKKSWVISR